MRSIAWAVVAVTLIGCGSSGGKALGSAVARAAVNVAAAAVATAVANRSSRRRQRRRDDTWEEPPGLPVEAPFEVYEYSVVSGEPARPPLPLYPDGLSVEVGPEDITCEVDADCVVLPRASCCSCAEGGTVVAVHAQSVERLTAALHCEAAVCAASEPTASCDAEPACVHGLCRLIPDEVVPPPPESTSGGEQPLTQVPEGYE